MAAPAEEGADVRDLIGIKVELRSLVQVFHLLGMTFEAVFRRFQQPQVTRQRT